MILESERAGILDGERGWESRGGMGSTRGGGIRGRCSRFGHYMVYDIKWFSVYIVLNSIFLMG